MERSAIAKAIPRKTVSRGDSTHHWGSKSPSGKIRESQLWPGGLFVWIGSTALAKSTRAALHKRLVKIEGGSSIFPLGDFEPQWCSVECPSTHGLSGDCFCYCTSFYGYVKSSKSSNHCTVEVHSFGAVMACVLFYQVESFRVSDIFLF